MNHSDMLNLLRVLADSTRLKIVGVLARKPHTVEQLAVMLALSASTISHHLARLASAGMVSAIAEGYYSVYKLEASAIERLAQRLLSRRTLIELSAEIDLSAYEGKVLAAFTEPDGRLKAIPAQRKKRDVILRHIVSAFPFGERWKEQQVNQILSGFHEDTATLRRELVGSGLLCREGGEYWREPEAKSEKD